jgi:negative regulator of sigma E activity
MKHLGPAEFVDALEDRLTPVTGRHLAACDRCRTELNELRQVAGAVAGEPAEPPSPLFWEHFSARVRAATNDLNTPRPRWWMTGWQPIAAAACVVVAVFTAQALHNRSTSSVGRRAPVADVARGPEFGAILADDESLNFVVQVAAGVPADDLQQAAWPNADATDAAVELLSPEQRVELARLVTARIREE